MKVENVSWFIPKREVEGSVHTQLYTAITKPYVTEAAVLPDVHLGYGLPIGTAVRTMDYIVPSWVGSDIGCGVVCIQIDLDIAELDFNKDMIVGELMKTIPIKEHQNDSKQFHLSSELTKDGKDIFNKANGFGQIGTLGGGNHFLEIGVGSVSGGVFIVLHSGSRGFGAKLCEHYDHEGCALMARSEMGKAYLNDYAIATQYAHRNRIAMLLEAKHALEQVMQRSIVFHWDTLINSVHNSLDEEPDGSFITRKGAASAEEGESTLVLGNMRDGSYIVRGLGNSKALFSCSHGAGRTMSRNQAKRTLDLVELEKEMEDNDVATSPLTKRSLPESPKAYKNVKDVVASQMGTLLAVEERVVPVVNYRG